MAPWTLRLYPGGSDSTLESRIAAQIAAWTLGLQPGGSDRILRAQIQWFPSQITYKFQDTAIDEKPHAMKFF